MVDQALVVRKTPNVTKKTDEQLVLDNLSSLQLNEKDYLTVNEQDRTILHKFFGKRTFLEKTPFESETMFQGTVVVSALAALAWLNISLFSVFDAMSLVLLPAASLAILFAIMIFFSFAEPSLSDMMEPFKKRKLYNVVHKKYSPELSAWLKNLYGIQVTSRHLREVAKLVDGHTCYISKILTDVNTGQEFKIVNRQGALMVTTSDSITVIPGDPQNLMRANTGLKQAETVIVTEKERHAVKKITDETLTRFNGKIGFIKTLRLTPENEYIVEHAEKEAAELIESMNLLKHFQDKKSTATVKDSFAVLEQELDDIIEKAKEEVHNKVKVQNYYLNSRKSPQLMLKTQKSLFRKILRA